MIAIDLSKKQALDADPKAIEQINFPANLDWPEQTPTYYWRSKTNRFRFFTRNCESVAVLLCFDIILA